MDGFTLQILHASDLEGGVDAIVEAPNFATIVDALEQDAVDMGIESVLISAGDNYIPGPFFNASGDPVNNTLFEGFYNELFGLIDTSVLPEAADLDADGFFDNTEIDAFLASADNTEALVASDVYIVDVNGDGFPDFFEEIDNFEGRIDIAIMNALGFDASAVGNHEFDAGTDTFENIINFDSEEGNSLSSTSLASVLEEFPEHLNFLQEVDTPGVQFPYLSANLDFSDDFDVGALFTDEILPSTDFASDLLSARENPDDPTEASFDSNDAKIAPATLIEREGELIGVVGATTQLVASISSTGNIDDTSGSGGTNDMPALAAVLQPVIDDLIAAGSNKIILTSHLQQFALEQELAGLLSGVDVIIAGGSDTIVADEDDRLRPEDTADITPYPFLTENADGDPVAVVSTDGEYSYVGRLIVEFDDQGVIIPDSIDDATTGAFATDDQGVVDVTGAVTVEEAIEASDKGTDVQNLTNAVTGIVTDLDSDIAGETEVFIEGRRTNVRTEETTLGNLTADANIFAVREFDPTVTVSLKNGGGIRAAIGETDADGNLLPTQANPLSGKEEGQVSLLDIQNSLRFNNSLVLVTLSSDDIKIILEHAVSATADGATPGQFAQVGGLRFSFDPTGTAQELDGDGNVVTEGSRILSVSLTDDDGLPTQLIVENGEVVDGAPEAIRVVTLDFLVAGGDGYPFQALGEDIFDTGIGEQQALFDFLEAEFPDEENAFDEVEQTTGRDVRIQNVVGLFEADGDPISDGRTDTIGAPTPTGELVVTRVQQFDSGVGEGGSEVVAHEDGVLFVTNGTTDSIDVFELGGNATGDAPILSIDLSTLPGFDGLNSVAVSNGVVAAAIERGPDGTGASQPGFIAFFDSTSGDLLSTVDVGNLPDAITFTADGTTLLVAGEGEFNEDAESTDDPLGTVSIVDVTDPTAPSATVLDFTAFDGAAPDGVRIFPDNEVSADLEPEFVAISPDGTTAFVSLQENASVAVVDLESQTITDILPLGSVDHSLEENAVDVQEDNIINLVTGPLEGLRMPDALASFEIGGETFFATANEGDSRGDAADGFDETELGDIVAGEVPGLEIDPDFLQELTDSGDLEIFSNLEISAIDGDTDGDGDIDQLVSFGGRTFSIFDAEGNLVFDSGSDFERIIAERNPAGFGSDEGPVFDEDRSEDAGPEVEAIETGVINGQTYAFVGLERDSGIMIYNITTPEDAFFVEYIPGFVEEGDFVGDISPEIIEFISAEESTTGNAQIAVAYEISGTTTVFDLALSPATPGETVEGTDGNDLIIGSSIADTLTGLAGDDIIGGREGDDSIDGGAGVDSLFGGTGSDNIDGGTEDDRIIGLTGDDTLLGSAGMDTIAGGADDDEIDGGADDDLVFGFSGNDTVSGGDGDDLLGGGSGVDLLFGGAGDDTVFAGSGNDQIEGGDGNDVLRASAGDDSLSGGAGDDSLFGAGGNDTLAGDEGDDEITLGAGGSDVVVFVDGFGSDTIMVFGVSDDALDFSGHSGVASLDDLTIAADGDDATVTDGDGNVATLIGVDAGDLTADNFIF